MEKLKYWIWISRIKGLGNVRISKLLDTYKDIEKIWNLTYKDIIKIEGIGEKLAKEILNDEYRKNLNQYIDYMKKYKIKCITIQDKEYPKNLKRIYDAPNIIYVKGNEKILKQKGIAVIGCRNCSEYGKEVARKIAKDLSYENINVISGLAKGIDSAAHIGCLKARGKTIAVLGSGLDRIYPKENIWLYEEIIKNGGAIVSEYVIGTKPTKLNFPARNRIISGLSDGVIVVEAKEKSGTSITVDFALEQGKNVFVVPGNITSNTSIGTNRLINQGAKCVTRVEDVLEEYTVM